MMLSASRSARRKRRRGLSLLEVLVAVVIFLIAFVALSELISISARRALLVEQRELAALKCQSKLDELIAGAQPLSSESGIPFDDDPDWQWSVEAEQNSQMPGLWNVRVRVHRMNADIGLVDCVVHQMILDPSIRGSTMDTATVAGTETTDTSGSTTGGASSPSSAGSGSTPK